jgi:hypothetical protein
MDQNHSKSLKFYTILPLFCSIFHQNCSKSLKFTQNHSIYTQNNSNLRSNLPENASNFRFLKNILLNRAEDADSGTGGGGSGSGILARARQLLGGGGSGSGSGGLGGLRAAAGGWQWQ